MTPPATGIRPLRGRASTARGEEYEATSHRSGHRCRAARGRCRDSAGRRTEDAANKLTVWLQVDAQTGWPDVVAAANQQFQQDHPGYTVDVQYQNWGDHLQKFDTSLAGGGGPDVIEMGNTEMTKYMAAGAFADLTSSKGTFQNSATWLKGLAASGIYGGKTYGVPYYAGSRVVTYRTDLWSKAGIKKPPISLTQFAADLARSQRRTRARRASRPPTSQAPTGTSR